MYKGQRQPGKKRKPEIDRVGLQEGFRSTVWQYALCGTLAETAGKYEKPPKNRGQLTQLLQKMCLGDALLCRYRP